MRADSGLCCLKDLDQAACAGPWKIMIVLSFVGRLASSGSCFLCVYVNHRLLFCSLFFSLFVLQILLFEESLLAIFLSFYGSFWCFACFILAFGSEHSCLFLFQPLFFTAICFWLLAFLISFFFGHQVPLAFEITFFGVSQITKKLFFNFQALAAKATLKCNCFMV